MENSSVIIKEITLISIAKYRTDKWVICLKNTITINIVRKQYRILENASIFMNFENIFFKNKIHEKEYKININAPIER